MRLRADNAHSKGTVMGDWLNSQGTGCEAKPGPCPFGARTHMLYYIPYIDKRLWLCGNCVRLLEESFPGVHFIQLRKW